MTFGVLTCLKPGIHGADGCQLPSLQTTLPSTVPHSRAPLTRRALLRHAALAAAACSVPQSLLGLGTDPDPDLARLEQWTATLRAAGLSAAKVPLGPSVVRVGELAAGTPYVPGTLDAYLTAGAALPATEPLTLSLTRFDCVTLVESCLGVARVARRDGAATWERFGQEIEAMRYRDGVRLGYASRLHYFSEWKIGRASCRERV